jgi:6,7-dimethyl-8-ribityllumazine synthase
MVDTIVGDLVVKPSQRFALVVGEFNKFITAKLAEGAIECLLRHGAKESQVTQVMVPGAFEIPVVAKELAKTGKYSGVICLGCVIRGETDHYDHVAGQVARGVGAVGAETGVAVGFGVVTADTVEQALNRAGLKAGNSGWHAALAVISTASVLAKVKGGHE